MRLDFLFTDLCQHFGANLVVFALKVFINWHVLHELQIKYKTRNFQNLIKKRLLRDIH